MSEQTTAERKTMSEQITADDVVGAARALDKEEFSRGDVAEKLGVEKQEIKKGFRAARHAGQLEKVRDDEENTGYFRLTGDEPAGDAEPAA